MPLPLLGEALAQRLDQLFPAERLDQLLFLVGQKSVRDLAQPGIRYRGVWVGRDFDPVEAVTKDPVEPVEMALVLDECGAREKVEFLNVEGGHTFLHRLHQRQVLAQRNRDLRLAQLDEKREEHG